VIISEFRFRGPNGASDEFVELYNDADSPVTVCASDNTAGWTLAARSSSFGSAVSPKFTIPNGTTIPARGHYLAVNSNGYSLGTNASDGNFTAPTPQIEPKNPLGDTNAPNPGWEVRALNLVVETGSTMIGGTPGAVNSNILSAQAVFDAATSLTRLTANGDQPYTTDTTDSSGIALFMTANPANADLYREGAGLAPIDNTDGEYSFVRKQASGFPQDTNDNVADFVFISTSGGMYGGIQSVLGAPSPENLSSPMHRNVGTTTLDPGVASTLPPNRIRCGPCTSQNAAYGTMTFRRTFTNKTGRTLTRLRFRVIDITTLNSPGYTPNGPQADLRMLSSGDVMVTRSDGSTVPVKGTVVETPPDQPSGGGLNTSMIVPLTDSGLTAGASIHAQFVVGIQKEGTFRFIVIVEALP
jgi:hypothetical protein